DADDAAARRQLVEDADLVVSMLPASLHPPVAEACVHYRKHFVSASYVSPELRALQAAAERSGIVLLNEMGVDPGIDHMSAMEKLDGLRDRGATITAFETFTGGLIAPESDDNPWHYKFTWNPRNVVLAGQGGVKFKHNGRYKYIPYHKLFARYEPLHVPGWGDFEGYPNRDSLKYRHDYDLYGVDTIYRGTLRRPGFCRAWDCLVQLGLTDDSYELEDLDGMTYRDFVNAYLWYDKEMSVELKIRAYLKLDLNSPELDRLAWLGLFDREPIGLERATPAQVLQKRLEEKWALGPDDKDMIVMLHKVEYELEGERLREQCSMVTVGDDTVRTAMAKTVGLATGIGAKLILTGEIDRAGVVIPTQRHVYEPVLRELYEHGIHFVEQPPVVLEPGEVTP
ncbi:MAG: saccharopine dehydrogenase NADP-binding domain-containing protein, partial [Myxococcales bacterium]|nr:saccharopine dehydrogenase NADP-binding domain-containing protein [Myxococcales bacterium]